MKTLLGEPLDKKTLGVLYLCDYDDIKNDLKVLDNIQFESTHDALQAYSNTRNPESQLAMGRTHEELIEKLSRLHEFMTTPEQYIYLRETL